MANPIGMISDPENHFTLQDKIILKENFLYISRDQTPTQLDCYSLPSLNKQVYNFTQVVSDVVSYKDHGRVAVVMIQPNIAELRTFDDVSLLLISVDKCERIIDLCAVSDNGELIIYVLGNDYNGDVNVYTLTLTSDDNLYRSHVNIKYNFSRPFRIIVNSNNKYIVNIYEDNRVANLYLSPGELKILSKGTYNDARYYGNYIEQVWGEVPVKIISSDEGFFKITLESNFLKLYQGEIHNEEEISSLQLPPDQYYDFMVNSNYVVVCGKSILLYNLSDLVIKITFKDLIREQNKGIHVSIGTEKYLKKYIKQFELKRQNSAWYEPDLAELLRIKLVQNPVVITKNKIYSILVPPNFEVELEDLAIVLGTSPGNIHILYDDLGEIPDIDLTY